MYIHMFICVIIEEKKNQQIIAYTYVYSFRVKNKL